MKNEQTSRVHTIDKRACESELSSWEDEYRNYAYLNVFDVNLDNELMRRFVASILPIHKNILILGCGSKTKLQELIVSTYDSVERIFCTDGSARAIELAQAGFSHSKVEYMLCRHDEILDRVKIVDLILICNSVLSESDQYNRYTISQCSSLLDPAGRMVGLFPSIFSALEQSIHTPAHSSWTEDGTIDLKKSVFADRLTDVKQTYYTPSVLAEILTSTGLSIESFGIHFFNSSEMRKEANRIYNISIENSLPIWEFFVIAERTQKRRAFCGLPSVADD